MKSQSVFKTVLLSTLVTLGLNFALGTLVTPKAYAVEGSESNGGSNGGGGKSSARKLVSATDLKRIVEITHNLARYNFTYLFNTSDDVPAPERSILNTIKKSYEKNSNFFSNIQLKISTDQACTLNIKPRPAAYYSNGTVCFDIQVLTQNKYSHSEAELAITALYAHEMAHAAGYPGDKETEKHIEKFQNIIESKLRAAQFNQDDYMNRLSFYGPKFDGSLPALLEAVLINKDYKRSRIWRCSTLVALTQAVSAIPINNRQEAKGLSIMSSEDETRTDMLIWELFIVSNINCDQYQGDMMTMSLTLSPTKTVSARDAFNMFSIPSIDPTFKDINYDYCTSEYSQQICLEAKNLQIPVHELSDDEFKVWSESLAKRFDVFLKRVTPDLDRLMLRQQ